MPRPPAPPLSPRPPAPPLSPTPAATPLRRLRPRPPRLPTAVPEPDVLEEALEHLVRGIVAHPDDVRVASRMLRRGNVLEVRVHPDDLGKVIGRGGRTARAPAAASRVPPRGPHVPPPRPAGVR